jgi:hypothetical protein
MTAELLNTHHAIVGSSGMGKTVTAKSEIEQLLREQRHLAVIDPTGVWYGLRSNAAGDGPGFDIPILGGAHGDIAITPADGWAIAEQIVEQRISAIVDLSDFEDDESQREFLDAFLRRLRARPRENFHLVIDEADVFCPQPSPDKAAFALTQVLKYFAKRSRVTGLVLTIITQRPADIDHTILSQSQTIIAHRLVDPRDRAAIDRYLKHAGDPEARKAVASTLPSLEIGERWVYSPGAGVLERGKTAPLGTFDSSRTPRAGEAAAVPRMLGELDVTALRAALAPTSDPSIPADPAEAYAVGRAAGEMLIERDRRIAELEQELQVAIEVGRDAHHALIEIRQLADVALVKGRLQLQEHLQPQGGEKASEGVSEDVAGGAGRSDKPPAAALPPKPAARKAPSATGTLTPAASDMLELLKAMAPEGFDWAELALLTGRKPAGGSINTARKALRDGGWVDDADGVITASRKSIDDPAIGLGHYPSDDELRERWGTILGPSRGEVIDQLARMGGSATPAAIAAALGRASHGGSWNTLLKDLRTAGVADRVGDQLVLNAHLRLAKD